MSHRVIIHLWLAFLLLFAQGGAIAHSVTHLADFAPLQSQHGKQLPHSPVCDKCVVYAEVGGSAPASTALFVALPFDQIVSSQFLSTIPVSSVRLNYSSRAPPELV